MVFSDTSTKTGLCEDADFICGTDSVSYPLVDKARNANRHYYKAVVDILKASGRFQFDDSNHTTLPTYTFDLVNAQEDYSLPTNLLELWAIEVKDAAGNWTRLTETDLTERVRTITDFSNTPGVPREYDVMGDSAYLYPAPATASVTTTAGGKMYFAREVDHFTSADTTQEPGIAEPFHRLISLGMAYDWLIVNDTTGKSDRILQTYEQIRSEMREFYGNKNRDTHTSIKLAHRTANYV